MTSTVLTVFETYAGDLKIDRNKVVQIISFYHRFLQANDEHIAFFSGNLVGVNQIFWLPRHRDEFIEEICEIIDYGSLEDDFRLLKGIEAGRHISGNPLNHAFLWLAYKIHNSTLIDKDTKEKGVIAVLSILQAKYLTGLHGHFFPHKADPSVAQAAFEELSMKSLIKQLGSWRKVIEYRSKKFYMKSSTMHWEAITTMGDTTVCVKFVNDIQNRVRKGLIKLARTFHSIHKREARILSTTPFKTIDAERMLKDIKNDTARYRKVILDILSERDDFVREELITATLRVIDTANETNLRKTLSFIFENAGSGKKKFDMTNEIQDLVVYIFDFIRITKTPPSDIPGIIGKLRSAYRSHKTSAPAVIAIKAKMEDVVKNAITANHEATRSATKVAALVYLSIRIMSIPHYNN